MCSSLSVPGVNCHNFTPVNAQEAISTHVLEKWKRKNRAAHQHFVERGTRKNFAGVTELIRGAMDRRVLVGMVRVRRRVLWPRKAPLSSASLQGVEFRQTRDDSHPWHQHDRYFDYHWPKLRRTRSQDRFFGIREHDPVFYGQEYDG